MFKEVLLMLSDRDQKFYFKLALSLLALLFIARCYLWFAEIPLDIPYVDPFIRTAWKVIGAAITGFYGATSFR